MAQMRRYGAEGRVRFSAPALAPRLTVPCPKCKALPTRRCYRISSWVKDSGHPDGGFYTELATKPHPERRPPNTAADGNERTALRAHISALAAKKLAGSDRLRVRRWSGSSHRTPDELRAKIDELEAQTDLAW